MQRITVSQGIHGARYALCSTVGAVLALAAAAGQAQTAAPAGGASESSELNEVIVTGTRRSDRTVTDSASPVDIISSAELRSQPAGNLLDEVKYLVPSFFVGQNTVADASSIVRAPSLRGLPSDEILVMLDGKRFNRSALVQVNSGGDTELAFGSQGSDISSASTRTMATARATSTPPTVASSSDTSASSTSPPSMTTTARRAAGSRAR